MAGLQSELVQIFLEIKYLHSSIYLLPPKRSKLCGNCAFPRNFRTRKLDEITVFYAVYVECNAGGYKWLEESRHLISKQSPS